MDTLDITRLGWDEHFESQFAGHRLKGLLAARVISRSIADLRLFCELGELPGQLSGKYRHAMESGMEAPVVGDWVAAGPKGGGLAVHALLARKTCFSRKPAISGGRKLTNNIISDGTTERQALAANIDTAFVVTGLDGNFNTGRIERFLAVARSSGALPVLLLNKADLCPDPSPRLAELRDIARGIDTHVLSAATGAGMETLARYLLPGRTVAFLGSSGAGKSTLVNRVFGLELQSTNEVSAASGKGKHTTSRGELFVHDSGAMLIDTPGIRELQLWCGGEALDECFDDIAGLIRQCRFSDCRHGNEPGCAVREALKTGALPRARYDSYMKLYGEVGRLEARKKQRDIMLARVRKRTP
jgi:ribosome biogenesis GTPase